MGSIERWDDWKCLTCDFVNGPKCGTLCDVCASDGEHGEVVELVRAGTYREAVEVDMGLIECSERLVKAVNDLLSSRRPGGGWASQDAAWAELDEAADALGALLTRRPKSSTGSRTGHEHERREDQTNREEQG
jgi:hypothetical protein